MHFCFGEKIKNKRSVILPTTFKLEMRKGSDHSYYDRYV